MHQNQAMPLSAILFTICICTAFGANAVAIKVCLEGMGPYTTAALRFVMASLAIYTWARLTGQSFAIDRRQVSQILIYTIIFTTQISLFYFGLSKTYAARATLLVNLQPFLVLLLAHFFVPGDRMTIRKFLGLLVGFLGVMLLLVEKAPWQAPYAIGDLVIVLVALLWSCNAVYAKRIIANFEPFQIVLYPMVLSIPVFMGEAFMWDHPPVRYLNVKIITALLYQGLVTASFGFVAWNALLQKYGTVALHSFLFILPVSGVFLSAIILGEPISAFILGSMVLIAMGIILVHFLPSKAVSLATVPKDI
jgi:drug/metabolite transporter (DMT)-like permease